MRPHHWLANQVNRWLPRYGWAFWFEREFRGPSVEEQQDPNWKPAMSPLRMRLGRYPEP